MYPYPKGVGRRARVRRAVRLEVCGRRRSAPGGLAVGWKIVAGKALTRGPGEGTNRSRELRGGGGGAPTASLTVSEAAGAGSAIFSRKPLDSRRRWGILRVCRVWVRDPSRWLFDKWTVVGCESV
jgi:hypothetical protein